jgi:hypothetical protein
MSLFEERDGCRYQASITNTQLAFLEDRGIAPTQESRTASGTRCRA